MRLIAGAKTGALRSIDQKSSGLLAAIEADRNKKIKDERDRIRDERIAIAQENTKKYQKEAEFYGSTAGKALEVGKGIGSAAANLATGIARLPVTLPMRAVLGIKEGITGTKQTYIPETGVEKFVYGSEPIQTYASDAGSISKFAQEKGVGKKASDILGGIGAAAEVGLDFAVPGAGGKLAKLAGDTFLGRALSRITGKTAKEITAAEVHETVSDAAKIVGRDLNDAEKTSVIDAISRGSNKDEIISTIKDASKNPEKVISAAEPAVITNKTKSAVEDIRTYMSTPSTGIKNESIEEIRKFGLTGNLKFDKNGNALLYRVGDVSEGKAQSYSTKKVFDDQVPVLVNKKDIVVDTTDDRLKDIFKKVYTEKSETGTSPADLYLEGLDRWNKLESEVIAISRKARKEVDSKTESPILKEINQHLDDQAKVDDKLPTTTFKKQFELASKEIEKDPAKAYNKALRPAAGEEEMKQSSLQLMLIKNAIEKGDDKALAELALPAARTGRSAGQTSVMFRALYDRDPMSRVLLDFARRKLANVESRFPKVLRKIASEGGDVVEKTTRAVRKKAQVTLKDAQSIIDGFICN